MIFPPPRPCNEINAVFRNFPHYGSRSLKSSIFPRILGIPTAAASIFQTRSAPAWTTIWWIKCTKTSHRTLRKRSRSSLFRLWCKQTDRLKNMSVTRLCLWWIPIWQMKLARPIPSQLNNWLCPNCSCARRICRSYQRKLTDPRMSQMSMVWGRTEVRASSLKRHSTRRRELTASSAIEATRCARTTA